MTCHSNASGLAVLAVWHTSFILYADAADVSYINFTQQLHGGEPTGNAEGVQRQLCWLTRTAGINKQSQLQGQFWSLHANVLAIDCPSTWSAGMLRRGGGGGGGGGKTRVLQAVSSSAQHRYDRNDFDLNGEHKTQRRGSKAGTRTRMTPQSGV